MMNKKKVALVLSGAMMFTGFVGQFPHSKGQANAVEIAPRLNPEDAELLKDITVKHLDLTLTEGKAAGEVLITMSSVLPANIKELAFAGATYTGFTERVDSTGAALDPVATPVFAMDTEKNVIKVTGVTSPGIYKDTVTVKYTSGLEETYVISFRQLPGVETLAGTVAVTAGGITVGGLKVVDEKGTELIAEDNIAAIDVNKVANNGTVTPVSTNLEYAAGGIMIPLPAGSMKAGDKYQVVYKYGKGGEYSATKEFVLVNQATPTLEGAITGYDASAEAIIALADEVYSTAAPSVAEESASGVISIDGQNMFSFQQDFTEAAGTEAHAGIDISTAATFDPTTGDLVLDPAGMTGGTTVAGVANYVFGEQIKLDSAATGDPDGLVGGYNITIGGTTAEYFNAESGVQFTPAKTDSAVTGTGAALKVFMEGVGLVTEITGNTDPITFNLDAEHGVNVFQADYTFTPGSDVVDLNSQLSAFKEANYDEATHSSFVISSVNILTPTSVKEVTTPIVIAVDKLDAVEINASVTERVSDKQIVVKLEGGSGLLTDAQKKPGSPESNKVKDLLKITGGTVETFRVSEGAGTDIFFTVNFTDAIPSSIDWEFTNTNAALSATPLTFNGTISTVSGENQVVELMKEVTLSNAGQEGTDVFEIVATLDTAVLPEVKGATQQYNTEGSLFVGLAKFTEGAGTISADTSKSTVKEKYQGIYEAGIWVSRSSFKTAMTVERASSTSAKVVITATDIDKDPAKGLEAVNYGKVVLTNKANPKDVVEVVLTDAQLTELKTKGTVTITTTKLTKDATYDVVSDIAIKTGEVIKESNTASGTVKLSQDNSTGPVTGGGTSTSGTSTGDDSVKITSNNSDTSNTSIGVTLPSSIKVDKDKTPVVNGFRYVDKNGKTVTARSDQFKNVKVAFDSKGNMRIGGLVPGKPYVNMRIDYTDDKGKVRTVVFDKFTLTTKEPDELYLSGVYEAVLNRFADEAGYHFHLERLQTEETSLREFLKNMLAEPEFLSIYKTTEEKIDGLYKTIVARDSDEEGKKFWTNKYDEFLKLYGSEELALLAVVEAMVNEPEVKSLAEKLGFTW